MNGGCNQGRNELPCRRQIEWATHRPPRTSDTTVQPVHVSIGTTGRRDLLWCAE